MSVNVITPVDRRPDTLVFAMLRHADVAQLSRAIDAAQAVNCGSMGS
jgi:hypothetical protein